MKGDSTVNQLTFLYHDILKALDEGKEVRAVFCDISKAFDRVWHPGLLTKLSAAGIQGNLINWFGSNLSDRTKRVVIGNSSSCWTTVEAGVPQGSILGPLLYLLYINDKVTDIQANIRLFADDTSLYIIVEDPASSAVALNLDLSRIISWSKSWLVSFNPSKTECMLFSRKRIKPIHLPLLMEQTSIAHVKTHTHLGLVLSEDAKWSSHISYILEKAWQRIGILRSLKYTLTRSNLEKMYITFIRPLLEYGDIIWDNCSVALKNDIESVQVEAARIVTGATKYCNIDRLLKDLNWESLSQRRKKHSMMQIYKMQNNIAPSYLCNLIPVRTSQAYDLRSQNGIPPVYANTQLYSNSFLPSAIRHWNNLSPDIRNSNSLLEFKKKITQCPTKSCPLFNVGDRKLQIYHSRLRLGCSSLNFDLHRRNITSSPDCICGAIETPSHFLIHCPRYQHIRQHCFTNLPCATTVNNLNGDEHLTYQENTILFLRVQKFIEATKRFDS
jgi:hypothetical protein